jgi:hypothetical protein
LWAYLQQIAIQAQEYWLTLRESSIYWFLFENGILRTSAATARVFEELFHYICRNIASHEASGTTPSQQPQQDNLHTRQIEEENSKGNIARK